MLDPAADSFRPGGAPSDVQASAAANRKQKNDNGAADRSRQARAGEVNPEVIWFIVAFLYAVRKQEAETMKHITIGPGTKRSLVVGVAIVAGIVLLGCSPEPDSGRLKVAVTVTPLAGFVDAIAPEIAEVRSPEFRRTAAKPDLISVVAACSCPGRGQHHPPQVARRS